MACAEQPAADTLTVAEAAALACVSIASVRLACVRGRLACVVVAGHRRIAVEALRAWAESRAPEAPDDWISARDAADRAGVVIESVIGAIVKGVLTACKAGPRLQWYVAPDALTAWLAARAAAVAALEARKEAAARRKAGWHARQVANAALREAAPSAKPIKGRAALEAAQRAEPTIRDAIAAFDAARLAGISWLTMRRAIARGDFESEYIGGTRVVSRDALIAWGRAKRLILGDAP